MAALSQLHPDTVELRECALRYLAESDVESKVSGVRRLALAWQAGQASLDVGAALHELPSMAGHPAKPELVAPHDVPRRAMHTPDGRAAMVHAMAHIEFNAINLALDALWRFPGMPREYYADWLQVADEEALHFTLLADHLGTLGYAYGDFSAHNGLWDMAHKTRHDVLARMALLPRTLEARGLDVTPGMKARLVQAGDAAIAPIMDVILCDEIGHVAIGNRWFNWLCVQRGLEPVAAYAELFAAFHVVPLRGPFNLEARRAAGFSDVEIQALSAQGSEGVRTA
ncbi:MAG: ferritin-like domain-containing protein [Gammaproteobacteria bacterium]|nr:ferritin-like domain-containing protein [Gammaproteobacteria bacterium]